jgi:hypothetical protein
MDKFDSKSNVGIFLGYFSFSKAYRVHNNRTLYLEESMYVVFEETQNDKIDEIIDDINENVEHISLNDKTLMEDNNEKMKDQPSSSHQQEMVNNSFVPPKKLRYM